MNRPPVPQLEKKTLTGYPVAHTSLEFIELLLIILHEGVFDGAESLAAEQHLANLISSLKRLNLRFASQSTTP